MVVQFLAWKVFSFQKNIACRRGRQTLLAHSIIVILISLLFLIVMKSLHRLSYLSL